MLGDSYIKKKLSQLVTQTLWHDDVYFMQTNSTMIHKYCTSKHLQEIIKPIESSLINKANS